MRAKFLHFADCHLGYRQYNLAERFNDFGRAFHFIVNTAIEEQVNFVLLAGDLFHKRSIDALALNQAMSALERLRNAQIPCIAVEGNHEHAYFDDYISWMEFLSYRQMIVLLDAKYTEGKPELKAFKRPRGSYFDPLEGVRVHGLRYHGAGTAKAIDAYAAALCDLPREGVKYNIFLTHAGIEGEVDQMGGLSMREWSCLREHTDYVALGHIHKPFTRDDWIYNPGSPETCSSTEAAWRERGYFLVEVDTDRQEGPKHAATLRANPRRPFERIFLKTDLYETPDALYKQVHELMSRRARDLGPARLQDGNQPVVALHLQGLLNFDRSALSVSHLEAMAKELLNALHPLVHNETHGADYEIAPGVTMNRQTLERYVLADLFSRDARFAPRSRKWARLALDLKSLTLDGAAPEAILEELEHRMARIENEPDDEPEIVQEAVQIAGQVDAESGAAEYAYLNG
jgi:DNA repair exonuclease SbcCD nuclease subunit